MKVIVFANKKGGVAKTISALAFAAGLHDRGYKVLAIDLDAQANFSSASGADADAMGALDFIKGEPFADCCQQLAKYDLLAADERMSDADSSLKGIGYQYKLAEALENVSGYDFVVIDTPPNVGVFVENALTAADEVIICCNSDSFSFDGLKQMRVNISAIQRYYNKRLTVKGVLLTRHKKNISLTRQLREAFDAGAEAMGAKVFQSVIRENTSLNEAIAFKQDIFTYDRRSNGAQDYNAFIEEYLSM